ncbi:MAG: futalosine hydrolase [Proteobacteria bacterium]|nr:futalosine hydrolase [Pseudomonadota bacterium]MBU1738750.1 futalosine hydrolase [Pseudomonadota bacterium]
MAPTKNEMFPVESGLKGIDSISCLVCGVGILESAVTLCRYLSRTENKISAVVLTGIAGAYRGGGAKLLDVCLAGKEVLGDLGICYPDRIDSLDASFAPETVFRVDPRLLAKARAVLTDAGILFHEGGFVTVSSVSATVKRGDYLQEKFSAICENMEGAAIARICNEFKLPYLEVRGISNMVVDREMQRWDVAGAISRCSEITCRIVERLAGEF